jgi:predicted DNA-binding transcriptional regulator YafY
MIVTPAAGLNESSVDARTLSKIAGACRNNEGLQFRYNDHAGAPSTRIVEPHRIVNVRRLWYLVAWDTGRKAWRTFRVDRMDRRLKVGPRCDPREAPSRDLAAYVSRGNWEAYGCRARILLKASAEEAARRVPPGVGVIEPIDEQSCHFELGAQTFETIATHLVLFGFDFEVREPAALVEEVQKVADRYRRATVVDEPGVRSRRQ